jgi:hypothetical protein
MKSLPRFLNPPDLPFSQLGEGEERGVAFSRTTRMLSLTERRWGLCFTFGQVF